jgi:hypothetical protein
VKRVHSLNIRPGGFFGFNYQEIFTFKQTWLPMQREKEGGFHSKSTENCFFREGFHQNVENNGLCALKVQPIMKLCVG